MLAPVLALTGPVPRLAQQGASQLPAGVLGLADSVREGLLLAWLGMLLE